MPRSTKKGFFVDTKLQKKIEKSKKSGSRKPIRTWSRSSTVTPEFVDCNIEVNKGKGFELVYVTENMVGHKLGEFAPTRKFAGHPTQSKK